MKLFRYLKEVFIASLPLLAIMIVVIGIAFPLQDPMQNLQIIIGYVGVVIGQAIFLVGLDYSILEIGQLVGGSITKLNKIVFVILFAFIFSVLATVAEPGIAVLASQVSDINPLIVQPVFIWVTSLGLGALVGVAVYRLVRGISMKKIFFFFYLALIILIFFVPNQFQALGFDASGAATGAISVPFVLALGVGVSHTVSKTKASEDSFGIVGIGAIGPIITIYVYGLIVGNNENLLPYAPGNIEFLNVILDNLLAVTLAIFPIVIIFFIYQAFFIKLPRKKLLQIGLATGVVFIGLFIFLTGTDYGLAFAGKHIGEVFVGTKVQWVLMPVSFLLGFAITLSEPSVVVFSEQVDELTNGAISKMLIKIALAISVGIASLLGVIKVFYDINILYLIVPLYIIAIGLIYFTPTLFVGLGFDGGTVSAGSITSAFLTPVMLGASQALGHTNILVSGLGVLGFISVMPRIVVQLLGIVYTARMKKVAHEIDVTEEHELTLFASEEE